MDFDFCVCMRICRRSVFYVRNETHQNLHAELERRRWSIATQHTLSLSNPSSLANQEAKTSSFVHFSSTLIERPS